ncbi:MAG: hypothetical protein PVG66_12900 [Chromatiales bacterium]|jgi:hypothetical protein
MRDWLLVVVAAGFLLVGYLAQRLDWFEADDPAIVVESDCDLRQQACELKLDNHDLRFSIEPRNFQALTPVTLQVRGGDVSLQRVSVEFEGLNMDMGYNLVRLESMADGGFQAIAMLPVCSLERMQWLVHLRVETAGKATDFQFRVDTWRG